MQTLMDYPTTILCDIVKIDFFWLRTEVMQNRPFGCAKGCFMPIVLFLETSSQFLLMSDCRLKQQHLQKLLLFVRCVQELLVGSRNFACRWSALHLLPLQEFYSRPPRAKCESHLTSIGFPAAFKSCALQHQILIIASPSVTQVSVRRIAARLGVVNTTSNFDGRSLYQKALMVSLHKRHVPVGFLR